MEIDNVSSCRYVTDFLRVILMFWGKHNIEHRRGTLFCTSVVVRLFSHAALESREHGLCSKVACFYSAGLPLNFICFSLSFVEFSCLFLVSGMRASYHARVSPVVGRTIIQKIIFVSVLKASVRSVKGRKFLCLYHLLSWRLFESYLFLTNFASKQKL